VRYLVTGGAGFIGSHLVEHLVGAGDEVIVLDDFSTGKRENLASVKDRIELIEGTITDAETCARACRGVDFVLHHAALASVSESLRDPVGTHHVNATGTLNLLLAARDAGVKRVVYAASSAAYDSSDVPKHEWMVARPASPYASSKLAGEHYCRAIFESFGLQTVALRYFNVFGPRQDPRSRYAAVVPNFVAAAQANEGPVIYGDGEQTRDFVFVANVVQANMLACTAPPEACCGEAFNIGCGSRTTINKLWQLIAELAGCAAQPHYVPPRGGEVRDSVASLQRAQRMLGYEPTVTLDDGLRHTLEWFTLREALDDLSKASAAAPEPNGRPADDVAEVQQASV
jgi:nucleoside-diphosphate-sugar epimerase